jgi:hypothetical protein
VAAGHDTQEHAPLDLSCRVCARGDVVVDLGGELDIASAEAAVTYVRVSSAAAAGRWLWT